MPGLYTIYGSDGATVSDVFELAADDIVFSVSSSMFEDCSALTRVSLPTMTGNIGSRAFYNCLSLSSVSLTLEPETSLVTGLAEPLQIGDYAFYGCESLETLSVTGLDSATSIGSYAFYGCELLPDDILSGFESVESIGQYAFAGCEAFTDVTMPESVTSAGNYIFYNCPNIQSLTIGMFNVSEYNSSTQEYVYENVYGTRLSSLFGTDGYIGTYSDYYQAYSGALPVSLTSVTLGNVNSVPSSYFRGAEYITTVSLDFAGTTYATPSIGSYAFSGCTRLNDSMFDTLDGVETIGIQAFAGCEAFTDVTIPDSVTSLGGNVFYNCPNIQSLTVDEYSYSNGYSSYNNLFTYVSNIFGTDESVGGLYSDYYSAYNGSVPVSLTSVTLGHVNSVPNYAFYGMTELTDVSLEFFNNTYYSATQSIGNYAFYGCENLDTFTVTGGEYVDSIGQYAFSGCTALPDDVFDYFTAVTSIGNYAFEGCEVFTEVTIPDSVTSFGSNIFYDCPNIQSLTVEEYSYSYSLNNVTTISSLFGASGQGNSSYDSSTGSYVYEFYYAYNNVYVPTALTTVTLGNVYRLADNAFYGMTELTDVTVNFVDEYSSSYSYPYIGSSAFYNCTGLETLTLNAEYGLYGVGTYAFGYCSSLTEIELPIRSGFAASNYIISTSYQLPYNVFTGCTALTEVTMGAPGSVSHSSSYARYMDRLLPDTVTTVNLKYYGTSSNGTYVIVNNLFYNCSQLTEINFEGSEVNSIGSNAFYGCTGLTNTATVDGNVILNGWVIGTDTASKTTLTLPESVVGIASGVFTGTITVVNFAGDETAWNAVIKNAVSFSADCTKNFNYVSETPAE